MIYRIEPESEKDNEKNTAKKKTVPCDSPQSQSWSRKRIHGGNVIMMCNKLSTQIRHMM